VFETRGLDLDLVQIENLVSSLCSLKYVLPRVHASSEKATLKQKVFCAFVNELEKGK